MMSNTATKNGSSEVHNKPDTDTSANSREKLRLIILSVAPRAHSHHWKMLDDTEDSVPSLLNISLDDVEHAVVSATRTPGNLSKGTWKHSCQRWTGTSLKQRIATV
jgi:hypothetical protein